MRRLPFSGTGGLMISLALLIVLIAALAATGFGEDVAGHLYVTNMSSGVVRRIVGPMAPKTRASWRSSGAT